MWKEGEKSMNAHAMGRQPIEILLVEDNPADVALTREALSEARIETRLNVVNDGSDAVEFLCRKEKFANAPRPDIILLDLNLPKKDGRQVLAEIKGNPDTAQIPVVVLTTSNDEEDIQKAYELHANCFISKPVDFKQFLRIICTIEDFCMGIVQLPRRI
jgi:two-component system, chemotaxis family, response regulator Rcp1